MTIILKYDLSGCKSESYFSSLLAFSLRGLSSAPSDVTFTLLINTARNKGICLALLSTSDGLMRSFGKSCEVSIISYEILKEGVAIRKSHISVKSRVFFTRFSMKGFVAVHVGAGYHSERLRPQYKKACKDACKAAIHLLKDEHHAIEAVTAAVSELEDCAITNAGTGSNLTLKGDVECDAGIMDGQSLNFGSVGAITNIKNPIKVAHRILEVQNNGLLSHGRIPPSTLAGYGALEFALENGFNKVGHRDLTTKSSRGIYLKNISLLQNTSAVMKSNDSNPSEQRSYDESTLLDTVGAVCVDVFGNVSSAVSSGGILLKHSGRIGQAAMYGSGCWAQNSISCDKPSIACSVTGVGEYLIKTLFAKECYNMLYKDFNSIFALRNIFKECFLESPYLKHASTKLAGTLAVKHYLQDNFCELSWVHTTRTMILGYMGGNDSKPSAVISVQPSEAVFGESIFGSEIRIKL